MGREGGDKKREQSTGTVQAAPAPRSGVGSAPAQGLDDPEALCRNSLLALHTHSAHFSVGLSDFPPCAFP